MKKIIKSLSASLCAILLLAGCSKENNDVKANISNGEENFVSGLKENVDSFTLEDVYNELKSSSANETVANKLIELLGDKLLLSDTTWKSRYDSKIVEKLVDLTENTAYFRDDKFDEELLVSTLNSQLYSVVCPQGTDGTLEVEALKCDYTNYINKALKVSVIDELLKEKYVYDKVFVDKTNILSSKKTRLVEYLAISSSETGASSFMDSAVEKLSKENSTETLETIAKAWEDKLIADLLEKYNKIGTKNDANGSIMSEFTGGYAYDKAKGLEEKKQAIYDVDYYYSQIVTSDNSNILTTTLVERILSENILSDTAGKTIKINNSYYVVNPLADSNVNETDIIVKDSSNSLYYLVKVTVIDKDSEDLLKYDAVKVLAKNTTLVSDYLNYYLEQNKNEISIHDEEVYEYLKTLYPTIFVD